jgi:hypothetical protein
LTRARAIGLVRDGGWPLKGVVFTEFLEMVEQRFSLAVVDAIIRRANPPHGGSYTAVGTYPAEEMVGLVAALGEVSNTPVRDLLFTFGEHLFGRFVAGYPSFFVGVVSPIEFLSKIDSYIHVEVKKLYPDAELPRFESEVISDREIHLTYHSPRRLAAFAHGLIAGAAKHFGTPLEIAQTDLSGGMGQDVRFEVRVQ